MKSASGILTALFCSALFAWGSTGPEPQSTFANPDAALKALILSFQQDNYSLFLATAGSEMKDLWSAGDPVRDELDRERLIDELHHTRFQRAPGDPERILLRLGTRGEPFPAPLVMSGGGWRFDGKSGAVELANRRMRRNESAAIDHCVQYVDAQLEYANEPHGAGKGAFAERIRANPGDKDGLYWANNGIVDESPLGPMFAQAAFAELGGLDRSRPYFGYYFKILVEQNALIAWPAEYGITGRNSFLVNHLGEIYQKDLGVETPATAARAESFNPDDGWTRVPPDLNDEY